MTDSELKRTVETRLRGEVRLRGREIRVTVDAGRVDLTGQVETLAEKRLALNLVRKLREVGEVRDAIRLATPGGMSDAQITQHVRDGLLQDGAIHDRDIEVGAKDGVVTLTGHLDNLEEKRLAGLIAWWVPGVADVRNLIAVVPEQPGTEGDLVDSIRQALDKDVLVNPDTIGVTVKAGTVTLLGTVGSQEERQAAEHDAYYVWGVEAVVNRLAVVPR